MWIDLDAEVPARTRDLARQAEERRMAVQARAARPGTRRSPVAYGRRLRRAAGAGLVRTGMRLLDTGTA